MPKFKLTAFNINLPFGLGGASLKLNEAQINAAWALYVEYATRISTQALSPGMGSVREALSSLHALFGITRAVLKEHGPAVGQSPESLGPIAIRLLNEGVRPFLVTWHSKLSAFETAEALRQQKVPIIDESKWEDYKAFYVALESLRENLLIYVEVLAKLAGVTKAHITVEDDD